MRTNDEELKESAPEDYTQEIAEVAYSYWESRGGEDGHDVEDWLTAEQEVMRRHRVQRTERQASAA